MSEARLSARSLPLSPAAMTWIGLAAVTVVLAQFGRDLSKLLDARWLGIVTPFGGLCFLGAWLSLVIAALRSR